MFFIKFTTKMLHYLASVRNSVWNTFLEDTTVLPVVLASHSLRVGLAGRGEAMERRRQWLEEAGVSPVPVALEGDDVLDGLKLLFVAGVPAAQASQLAARARKGGVLVNVEDEIALCDFHVPALVRRGDLLISVSTGGRAPGLARLVREFLAERFGPEWSAYLDQAGRSRARWRSEGLAGADLTRRTRALAEERRWFA
jgi:precorrin-2 dehydrogenase/sirohydrochlorin ferrochelatase